MNKFISLSATTIALFISANTQTTEACTRVLWNTQNGYMLSSRNLDFFGPVDPSLVVTPRGVAHVGADGENAKLAPKWKSKYGTVIIYADDVFPMDGMNETGLAGHTLYFTGGAEEEKKGQDKPILESPHWLEYILDNHKTVAEAVEAIGRVRLVPNRLPIDYASDTKHIAIEDKSGDSAVIEIVNGEVKIYHGPQYRVMTNPPPYSTMLEQIDKYSKSTQSTIPHDWSAEARLLRADWLLKYLPAPRNAEEAQGFLSTIMHSVAMPIGLPPDGLDLAVEKIYEPYSKYPELNRGVGTYWTTTADLINLRYSFQSASTISPIWLNLRELNFRENKPTLRIENVNLYGSNQWIGNVKAHLKSMKTRHINRKTAK